MTSFWEPTLIPLSFKALQQKKEAPLSKNLLAIAERQGFEPWEQLPVHRISSAARSTTPASFPLLRHKSRKKSDSLCLWAPVFCGGMIDFVHKKGAPYEKMHLTLFALRTAYSII